MTGHMRGCDSNGFDVSQVISIVTAGGANGEGLFYPNGLNGAINGSSASAAALSIDIAGRRKLLVSLADPLTRH